MRKRPIVQSVLGLGIGLTLCWLLISKTAVTMADVTTLLAQFQLWPALIILLLTLALQECGARKWAYLDQQLDGKTKHPHRFYWRHGIWQSWLGQILPSPVALIAGRAVVTHATDGNKNWRRGLRSGLLDQLGDLGAFMAFIPATLWQLITQGSWGAWLAEGLATYAVLGWLGCKILPRYIQPVLLGWSLARAVLLTVRLILGAAVFGLPIAAASIAFATPLATLTAILPLTPGNLGITEWGWNYTLGLWHIAPVTTLLYTMSFRFLILAVQTLLLLVLPRLRG